MKSRVMALSGLIALLGVGATFGVMAQNPPVTTPPVRVGKMGKMGKEHHPELNRALRALNNAKMDLQKANRDFDGHRTKAAELTEQAISEVKAAIASDKH